MDVFKAVNTNYQADGIDSESFVGFSRWSWLLQNHLGIPLMKNEDSWAALCSRG